MKQHPKVALIGGQGNFPFLVRDALRIQGYEVFVLAYHGITPQELTCNTEHAWLSLGKVQQALKFLQAHNIQSIMLTGKFYRPKLSTLYPDALGRKLLYRLAQNWFGDDALLKTLIAFLAELGLTILRAQDVLPHLLTQKGGIGVQKLSESVLLDIETGKHVLRKISSFDIGQGLAVQQQRILGIEAAEGTDQCIVRCGLLAEKVSNAEKPVYVKMAKIQQSRDLDLPVIGEDTLKALSVAGFQGLGIEAETVLIVDQHNIEELAAHYGVFIWKF